MDRSRDLFWRLLEPEHPRTRAFCRKLTGNREDGDDLYQDALVAALQKFEHLREATSFRPWLYRTVVNTFRNRVRRPWWTRIVPLTTEIEETAGGVNPANVYAARRRLERAFRAISPEDQALVTLFEIEGWSIAELVRMTGKRQSAVKTRLSRARRKMRDTLLRSQRVRDTKPIVAVSKEDICVVTKPGVD